MQEKKREKEENLILASNAAIENSEVLDYYRNYEKASHLFQKY